MTHLKEHWDNVFESKNENEVSWFQSNPETSLGFFRRKEISKEAKIIDVGGGNSYLIDSLLILGYTNLTVVDISEIALSKLKNRLGEKAKWVTFIVSNILDFKPTEKYDVWHDRACFHFLTQQSDIAQYSLTVQNSLVDNGYLFIGTFSHNGPDKCSGLPITKYNDEMLCDVFPFLLNNTLITNHQTPFNTIQNFIFCEFIK